MWFEEGCGYDKTLIVNGRDVPRLRDTADGQKHGKSRKIRLTIQDLVCGFDLLKDYALFFLYSSYIHPILVLYSSYIIHLFH